jgi:hypothetical protein
MMRCQDINCQLMSVDVLKKESDHPLLFEDRPRPGGWSLHRCAPSTVDRRGLMSCGGANPNERVEGFACHHTLALR